jgi:hypothetical protein
MSLRNGTNVAAMTVIRASQRFIGSTPDEAIANAKKWALENGFREPQVDRVEMTYQLDNGTPVAWDCAISESRK